MNSQSKLYFVAVCCCLLVQNTLFICVMTLSLTGQVIHPSIHPYINPSTFSIHPMIPFFTHLPPDSPEVTIPSLLKILGTWSGPKGFMPVLPSRPYVGFCEGFLKC